MFISPNIAIQNMSKNKQDNFMVDGYLGGVNSVTRATDISSANSQIQQADDTTKNGGFMEYKKSKKKDKRLKSSAITEDVSIKIDHRKNIRSRELSEKDVKGLTILPWEEFVRNPKKLNELFYLESNGIITFDPEDVNVFFHATRMNRPNFGDISENGRAWILNVVKIEEIDYLRIWLTERVSVFGVTLVKSGKRFSKSERAPCLLTLNPKYGSLGEQISSALYKSMAQMKANKKFCIEINLNGCVERWCQDVMGTDCRAVGARLVITNGEEKEKFDDLEDIICCVACFPIWALQNAIYKIHRRAAYTDHYVDLGTEPLFLHGSAGSVENQRQKLFRDYGRGAIFRTKPDDNGLTQMTENFDTDAYKYICVKKYERKQGEALAAKLVEHKTTNLQNLMSKRIVKEEINLAIENDEEENVDDTKNVTDDAKFDAFVSKEVSVEYHTDEYKKHHTIEEEIHKGQQIELKEMSVTKRASEDGGGETEIHSFREPIEESVAENRKVKQANWDIADDEETIANDIVTSASTTKIDNSKLISSLKYQTMPVVTEEQSDIEKNKSLLPEKVDNEEKLSTAPSERYDVKVMLKNRHQKTQKPEGKLFSETDVSNHGTYDHDDFARNTKLVAEKDCIVDDESKTSILIPVSKTDETNLFDTTDFDDESKILNDNELTCCDVEDLEKDDVETNSNANHKPANLQTNERRRGRPQYDSRRKYLGVPMPKKQTMKNHSSVIQDSSNVDVDL